MIIAIRSLLECMVGEKHNGQIRCTIIVHFSSGNIKGISGDSGLFLLNNLHTQILLLRDFEQQDLTYIASSASRIVSFENC